MYYDEKSIARLATLLAARIRADLQDSAKTAKHGSRLMTVKEAAEYLGRAVSAVQHLIFRRELPVVRVGRRVHLDRVELDHWIERNLV